MRAVMLSVAWLAGSAVLAGLLLRLASGDEIRLARYTGYVMPWLLVGVVPGAVWAWRARARALAAALALSAAIIAAAHARLLERRAAPDRPPSAATLSIMSYNTWSQNRDAERIARVVSRSAPDLVLFQEIPRDVFDRLGVLLGDLYGGGRAVHAAYEPAIQQGVVSRYPLRSSTAMRDKGQAQRVVVDGPRGPVAVFNVHPLRDGGWRRRYDQMAALLEEDVLPERTPVILAGDVNAPEHSQVYALVAAHLEDAHRSAGSGFGFTYPAAGLRLLGRFPAWPVVRVDHVFFSRHFVALRAETLRDSGGSDHRPVVAELAITSRGREGIASEVAGAEPPGAGGRVRAGRPDAE